MAVYKEKLRAMKEALKFTTDELESREVEVAQLRVAQQMAEEETAEWRAQKDIIDKKVKHSSTALRNVLQVCILSTLHVSSSKGRRNVL